MEIIKRHTGLVIILFLMGFMLLPQCSQAQDRKRLESEKARLEKEINNMNAILRETKKNKKVSASELQIIRKKIEKQQNLVNNISSQINDLNSQIRSTQQSITDSYRDLEVMKQNYASLLRYAQKNHTATSRLLFIFSAKDYHEAYQRYVFFRRYGRIQRQQMLLIENKTKELSSMTDDLVKQKKDQNRLLWQEKINSASLDNERKKQEKAVNDIKSQEAKIAKQLKDAQAKKKKLQQQINAAVNAEVAKQQKKAAASNNKTAVAKASGTSEKKTEKKYVMSATPKEVELSNSFESNKGRLPWPVERGVIVSGFGVHPHPDIKGVQVENLGVDIRTTKGSRVKSVFEGEVCKVWTGPNGNKIVIIRHGEYMTVYTNLASVSVSDGTKVSTGQAIGTIATNSNGQSEMNFQVRKETKCQNPVLWLKR